MTERLRKKRGHHGDKRGDSEFRIFREDEIWIDYRDQSSGSTDLFERRGTLWGEEDFGRVFGRTAPRSSNRRKCIGIKLL
jgi:hypothetical protein